MLYPYGQTVAYIRELFGDNFEVDWLDTFGRECGEGVWVEVGGTGRTSGRTRVCMWSEYTLYRLVLDSIQVSVW